MKTHLLIVILLISSFKSFSQLKTIYYDADWKKVSNQNLASYYREAYSKNDTLFVTDYYAGGIKQMQGQFADRHGKTKIGWFTYYHNNGVKSSAGFYLSNKEDGEWVSWNSKGIKESEGKYANGLKVGEWLIFDADGVMKQKWQYDERGEITKVKEFKKNGEELNENDTFTMCDQMPQFDKTTDGLFKFLAKNIEYPKYARENNIQGRVVVSFIVDKSGNLSDFQVVKSVNSNLEEEALRVLKLSAPWIPGKHNGNNVCVRFMMPIVFKLN